MSGRKRENLVNKDHDPCFSLPSTGTWSGRQRLSTHQIIRSSRALLLQGGRQTEPQRTQKGCHCKRPDDSEPGPNTSWGAEKLSYSLNNFVPLPFATRQSGKKALHGFPRSGQSCVLCSGGPRNRQAPTYLASLAPRTG